MHLRLDSKRPVWFSRRGGLCGNTGFDAFPGTRFTNSMRVVIRQRFISVREESSVEVSQVLRLEFGLGSSGETWESWNEQWNRGLWSLCSGSNSGSALGSDVSGDGVSFRGGRFLHECCRFANSLLVACRAPAILESEPTGKPVRKRRFCLPPGRLRVSGSEVSLRARAIRLNLRSGGFSFRGSPLKPYVRSHNHY